MNLRGQPAAHSPTVPGELPPQADAALLAAYVATRSSQAFAPIVERHHAMVFRVCQRLVQNPHDAEDASQAVFLVLARRPNLVSHSLAGWLHKVARDMATDLLRARLSRARREEEATRMRLAQRHVAECHLREEIDAALARLPARLQEAVVLRYLEGRSQEEAARVAGIPQGTLARRAMEGLDRLRSVLARRGAMVAPGLLVTFLTAEAAAQVPVAAAATTAQLVAVGAALESTGQAAVLANGALQAMFWAKVKVASAAVMAATASCIAIQTALPRGPANYVERASLVGHTGGVYAAAFTPDGRTLATGGGDRMVRLWDVEAGTERTAWRAHDSFVRAVAYSPNANTLATGAEDGTIKVWDASSASQRSLMRGHREAITALAFSPNGQLLVSASWDGLIILWDPADGSRRGTLKGHTSGVAGVSFSPDGHRLASVSNDRTVRLWDWASGANLLTLEGHTGPIHAMAFAPDGRQVASGATDGTIRLWDLAAGRQTASLSGHSGEVVALAYTPDGQTLASGGIDKTVKLWDLATGKAYASLAGHDNGVGTLVFTTDGRIMASASWDRTAKLYDRK